MVVELNPNYITDKSGEKISVILSIDEYENLLEELEDLVSVAERKDEKVISHEELLRELVDDCII